MILYDKDRVFFCGPIGEDARKGTIRINGEDILIAWDSGGVKTAYLWDAYHWLGSTDFTFCVLDEGYL